MKITVTFFVIEKGKPKVQHRRTFRSAQAAGEAIRGVSCDRVRIKVDLATPAEAQALAALMPTVAEVFAPAPT